MRHELAPDRSAMTTNHPVPRLKQEWPLLVSIVTAGAFLALAGALPGNLENTAWFVVVFAWLLGTILLSAFAIVRHAEALAVRLGEPMGTLVLTLAVTGIEVML